MTDKEPKPFDEKYFTVTFGNMEGTLAIDVTGHSQSDQAVVTYAIFRLFTEALKACPSCLQTALRWVMEAHGPEAADADEPVDPEDNGVRH